MQSNALESELTSLMNSAKQKQRITEVTNAKTRSLALNLVE